MKTYLFAVVLAAVVFPVLGPSVEAKEASDAVALTKRLGALRKASDQSELASALDEVAEVYQRTGPAAEKSKLLKEVGRIAKQKDLGLARSAAVRALAAVGDAKLAWQALSSLLPTAKVAEASELDLATVQAAGKLAQPKAAKALLGLVAKAKDPRLATAAAEALGGFRTPPKTRLLVLKELVALGTRLATVAGAAGAPEATLDRWKLLGASLTRGLNRLTGQELDSFDDWRALYETHKGDPKQLLTNSEE